MGYFYPPIIAATPGAQGAPAAVYESQGFGSTGAGTVITSGSANTPGAWTAIGGATGAEWNGFVANVYATQRCMLDFALGDPGSGGVTVLTNLMFISATGVSHSMNLPINVPAGATLYCRARTSSVAQSIAVSARGRRKGTLDFAGFSAGEGIGMNTATTQSGSINVPLTSTFTTIATTARAYGSLAWYVQGNGTLFGTAQPIVLTLGVGAGPTAVDFALIRVLAATTSVSNFYRLYESAIGSGVVIAMKADAATPGTDNFFAGLVGFY